ncbi:hypothetical protein Cob_v000974 [Colletotrichum orbiculare MAFF 240422]|uniref:Uncharacterized protein n=1 Tax=Colletotrichum orbiculare (strain 104-T / ATCC 96160 / CBS 514.97 / LARS 414 / MAFF 240422) TaxID=1213857 RepID=A0A484G856_COLOR|nr:hypothetical protein Cob_v000974 [Colletotrichum orbiculare MAFF 240422]
MSRHEAVLRLQLTPAPANKPKLPTTELTASTGIAFGSSGQLTVPILPHRPAGGTYSNPCEPSTSPQRFLLGQNSFPRFASFQNPVYTVEFLL